MSNERGKEILLKSGANCEREPDWIKEGRKPDFYCTGKNEFWCEIKTLEQTGDSVQLGNAHVELRKRAKNITTHGKGFAYVSRDFTSRDAKHVTQLLRRALLRFQESNAPARSVAVVPAIPNYSQFVRFSLSTSEHSTIEIHSCLSASGKYGLPMGFHLQPYIQSTKIRFSTGEEKDLPARNILTMTDDFRVGVVLQADDKPFRYLATAPTGGAKRSRNVERIRETVSEANSQFKNAIVYKAAPTLLMIFHEGLDVSDDEIVKSALYGDLKYSFSPQKFDQGKLILDGNAAWNREKNRTTSAVMYVRNKGQPLVVHNYWATRPFPHGVFSCKDVRAVDSGTFSETDHSPPQ